jgi:hypothetical protein
MRRRSNAHLSAVEHWLTTRRRRRQTLTVNRRAAQLVVIKEASLCRGRLEKENAMTLRILAAVGVLVSAAVHLKLWWADGYRDIAVIGPSFMLNAVAGVVIAVLLIVWRHWVPLALAIGFGAATLGAFIISATVGLFGVHETWTGVWVLTAAASEVLAIVAGGLALRSEQPWRRHEQLQDDLTSRRAHLR